MKRHIRFLACAAAAASLLAGPASAQTVTFTTLPQGTIFHFMATIISKMLLEKTDLKVRVTPMRGTAAQFAAVERGRSDLMLADVTQAAAAIEGKEAYKGRATKNLRAIGRLLSFPVGIMVKKDSPYRKMSDLKGTRVPAGFKAFPQGEVLVRANLAMAGLTYDDVKRVLVPELIRSWDDFKAGKTDSTSIAPTAPKAKELDAALGGVRFLPIPNTPQTVAALKSVRKDFYLSQLKPAPYLPGVLEPMYMLTFDVAVTTGVHVSDEVVTKVTKALYENRAILAKGHAALRGFVPKLMGKQFSVLRHHQAAERFLKEKGVWPAS